MLILKRNHLFRREKLTSTTAYGFYSNSYEGKTQVGIQKKNSTLSTKNGLDMNYFKITATGETKVM